MVLVASLESGTLPLVRGMGIVRGGSLGGHANETNDRRRHSAGVVVSIRSTRNGLRVVVFHFHFCRSFGVFVQRGRCVFVWHGQPIELQPWHGVREVFIIHVGGTRCVTSSTDNIMKIRARITLTVEVIRTCIFLFLFYV